MKTKVEEMIRDRIIVVISSSKYSEWCININSICLISKSTRCCQTINVLHTPGPSKNSFPLENDGVSFVSPVRFENVRYGEYNSRRCTR